MLLLGRDSRASASAFPSEIWSPGLRLPGRTLRGVSRISQVTGPSSSCAPRSITPPGVPSPRPPFSCGHGATAFRNDSPLGTWNFLFVSRPYPRGSHVRRPTHRRDSHPQRRKALLPACRAQLWPGGFRTHWTTYRISVGIATSFPFGPALPGRFYHQTLFNGGGRIEVILTVVSGCGEASAPVQ